jgi:hypothetical protein
MSDERFEELTPAERSAFESVSRPVTPPPACEDAIVAALREQGRIRDGEAMRGSFAPTFAQRLRRWVPRVALATAALAGTFFLGATYGRRTAPLDVPAAVQLDVLPGIEEAQGDLFKNEDGELVLTAVLEAQGVRPGQTLALASAEKPSVGVGDPTLGGPDESFSLRYPSR